jgi:hypothetical protein
MLEKFVNYQIGIFGISLKKLTPDACSRSVPLGISSMLTQFNLKLKI